jgi:predicted GIY-YIG superfamily endonuclease
MTLMKQMRLFPPPSPLRARLGDDFFRSAPRAPGVYIMSGEAERILYIGQSQNLRVRLASYKNARPDRAPRKVIRLIHQVRSIVWEKCDSAAEAKSRETELLQSHRPKFNVADTFPPPRKCIVARWSEDGVELDCVKEPAPPALGSSIHGPFKSRAIAVYGAVLRLGWAAANQPRSPSEFPAGLFSPRPPRPCFIRLQSRADVLQFKARLCSFLDGISAELVAFLTSTLPLDDRVAPVLTASQTLDLETLTNFFRVIQPASLLGSEGLEPDALNEPEAAQQRDHDGAGRHPAP